MTLKRIEALCVEWQKALRLQDWDIDITIERYYDLEPQGRCTVSRELKYARIRLRDPQDQLPPGCKAHFDMEQVLVHEMLHIHFDALRVEKSEIELVALEQALIGVGTALVALKRQAKKARNKSSGHRSNVVPS